MKSFIYDHYGYSLDSDKETFDYRNFTFGLEKNHKTIKETEEMNNYAILLSKELFNRISYIVPSRNNKLEINSPYGMVSLVAVENFSVNLDDFIKIQQATFNKNNSITLTQIKNKWIEKLNFIERQVLPSLKVDDYYYQIIFICFVHASGMASNAITYLEDCIIDYGNNIEITSITHKRVKLNSYDLLNPFNLIIDSPMRDFAELFKSNLISVEKLIEVFNLYQINSKDASIFFSRVLYPSDFFDLLIDEYEKRGDIFRHIENYYFSMKENLQRIKKIHSYLTKNYGIRKINWIDAII